MKTFLTLLACCAALPAAYAEDPPTKPAKVPEPVPNHLTDEEKADGWRLLFDGEYADGLRGVQSPDFLDAGWKIEQGELFLPKDAEAKGKITGGDLISVESLLDFEFTFDFRFVGSASSGVRYLVRRGEGYEVNGLEYQIIDDSLHPESLGGGPVHRTGALDAIFAPCQDKVLHEIGYWNTGKIVVLGARVEHWLNGAKVLEYDLASDRLMAAARAAKVPMGETFGAKFRSPIVLMDQGEEVHFRNLKIRALPPVPAAPR